MKKYISTLLLFTLGVVSHNAMAAVGFSVSLSPSTTTINHPVQVNLSALNGLATQYTVTNVKLTATSTSNPGSSRIPMALSVFNPNNTAITIGAGPNLSTSFNGGTVVFFSPSTGVTGSGTGTYSIGGVVSLSGGLGDVAISTGAAATINPVPLPLYERL